MLSPSEYDRLCDQLITLYDDLDNAIIEDMTRRMMRMGGVTEATKWQAKQLQESGLLYDDIIAGIARRTDASQNQVRTLFEDAGVQSIRNDNRYYRAAGLEGIVKMSDSALQTLYAGYVKCNGNLQNLTLTTANTAQTAYINACNLAYMQITSGTMDYSTAIRRAVQSSAGAGSWVLYPSGHRDRLDVAVRRSALTGVGQTVRQISLINANDMGCDLMEITAHAGARPSHAAWQGKIVSLSGRRGYLSLNDIGYGTGDGFGGWNCRHDWFPFFEGISEPAYTPRRLAELNEPCIEINGQMYTEYEVSQMQRELERRVREMKRRVTAADTAVDSAQNDMQEKIMRELFTSESVKLKKAEQKLGDFLNQTGNLPDSTRIWVNVFGRNISQKAVHANKSLTSSNTRGIIKGRGNGKVVFTDSDGHYCELIGKIDYNDKNAVARSLMEFETKYKDSDIEHCRIITVSGDVYESHGDKWTVNTEMLGDLMNGSINEHNHVTGESQYSFSWDDIEVSNRDGTNTAFAFDEKYRYAMVFPDIMIPKDILSDEYDFFFNEISSINYNSVSVEGKGKVISDEDFQHEVIRRTCEKVGIKYVRIPKKT